MKNHETPKDHQSESNGEETSLARLSEPWGEGRDLDYCLDLGITGLTIDSCNEFVCAESPNNCHLDPRCQCSGFGLFRGSSFAELPSGDPGSGQRVRSGIGERSQRFWNPSILLGWNFGDGVFDI